MTDEVDYVFDDASAMTAFMSYRTRAMGLVRSTEAISPSFNTLDGSRFPVYTSRRL